MKRFFLTIIVSAFVSLIPPICSASTADGLSGRILLQVEKNGEAWYVYPVTGEQIFLGNPITAWEKMKSLGIAISDEQQLQIAENRAPRLLAGLFLRLGQGLLYVRPDNLQTVRLAGPNDAFRLVRDYGLGVKNELVDGSSVALASAQNSPVLDLSGYDDLSRWWGKINSDYVPVYDSPASSSSRVGWLWSVNRVKVLEEVNVNEAEGGILWYKIDGGQYPGAYVQSTFVDFIPQPLPPAAPEIPSEVKPGDYWVDVNLEKNILSLYRYHVAVFSTYIAQGTPFFPTRTGLYHIQTKLIKTRMSGGPPRFPAPYDLPNVPYTMYYNGSYAIHGTYWHDKFGSPQSHGCTNLTQGDAKYVFERVSPVLGGDMSVIRADAQHPGTVVYNHY